jgi:hypothetical protein
VTQEDFEFAIAKVFAVTLTPYGYLTIIHDLGSQEEPGREYLGQQVVFVDTPCLLSIHCNDVCLRLSRNAPVALSSREGSFLQADKPDLRAILEEIIGHGRHFKAMSKADSEWSQRLPGVPSRFVNVIPSLGRGRIMINHVRCPPQQFDCGWRSLSDAGMRQPVATA